MNAAIVIAILGGSLIAILSGMQAVERNRMRSSLSAYRLGFPRDLQAEDVVSALAGFSGLLLPWWKRWLAAPFVSVEVHATSDGIEHYVVVPASWSGQIENVLQSSLPSVRFEVVDVPGADVRRAIEYRLSSHGRVLNVDSKSMSAGLLANLQPLKKEEKVVVQWILTPHPPVAPAKPTLPGSNGSTSIWSQPLDSEDVGALRQKQSQPLLLASGRIGAWAAVSGSEVARLRSVEGAWHASRAPGVHLRRRWVPRTWTAQAIEQRRPPGSSWPATMNVEEMAGFIGWPIGLLGMPGLRLGGSRQLPATPAIPRTGIVLADSTFPGDARPLAMDVKSRLTHLHLLGPTGVGKSNLISQLAIEDMEAGLGVILIDGKGDLCEEILARIPEHRRDDVILFDPSDTGNPVGINPLETAHGASAEVVVENLVGMFKSLYSQSWGPRLEYVLRSALLTLAAVEGTTLCEVPLILNDASYRRRIVSKLDDPIGLEAFWGWYESLSDAERSVAISPVMNKLQSLAARPTIRSIIGQSQPSLNFRDVMKEGKIVLCSLSSGMLGDDAAALLGALIVAEVWHATTARAGLPPAQRTPVMVHIDEFARFVHLPTPMPTVLAEARGLGCGFALAHQGMDQLSADLKSAVLSNCRSRVLFQLPAADARIMAKELGGMLTPDDLQGLDAFEVVCQIFAENRTQAPVTGRTRKLGPPTTDPIAIRNASRGRFGVPREEVERSIRERQSGTVSGTIGRKPRSGGGS